MFSGKNIVITGAASGIGRALVQNFLDQKASVVGLDIDSTALAALQEEANRFGWDFESFSVDVCDAKALRQTRDTILQRKPQIDYWINNAGVAALGDFMATEQDVIERVIQINLNGVMLGTRVAIEAMEAKGIGTIVNMASVAGYLSAPYLAAYCASKHGVIGFTRAMRQELSLKECPIKLVLASPGFVNTKMIAKGERDGFPEWLGWTLATPEKVAHEIVRGLMRQDSDIFPTWNGKIMLAAAKFFPKTTMRSSRILLAKNMRDLVFLRKQPPKVAKTPSAKKRKSS